MKYIELFRTFNQGDIAVLKSIFDAEGIDYYVQGENFNLIRPAVEAPSFMVRQDFLEDARNAISGLDISYNPKIKWD